MPEAKTEYLVRVSGRAKHARLVVDTDGKLTVVIPRRYGRCNVDDMVARHCRWIDRTRARLALDSLEKVVSLPDHVDLPVIGERIIWPLVQGRSAAPIAGSGDTTPDLVSTDRSTSAGSTQCTQPADQVRRQLTLWSGGYYAGHSFEPCGSPDASGATELLREKVASRARETLPELLHQIAFELNLIPTRVSVRSQRSRWASCSPSGTISLNWRLLLLPDRLLRHLFIHELCHLRELNHSSRFWALVERYDPEWRTHRKELRIFERNLPGWARFDATRPR